MSTFLRCLTASACIATASVAWAQTEKSVDPPIDLSEATIVPAEERAYATEEVLQEIERVRRGPRPDEVDADDFERLLGWWVVESCTMNGGPVADSAGQVQHFQRNGEVEIHDLDFWARQHFVVDVTTVPKRLGTSYTEGFIDSPSIYVFEGDRLKIRKSLVAQELSFDKRPREDFWDITMRKVTEEEAQRLLADLERRQDEKRAAEEAGEGAANGETD